jgi:hypothetical protein
MRYILVFFVWWTALAGIPPQLELVSRKGLTAHLRITNPNYEKIFLAPYFLIEEYYDVPAVEGGARGWIATRPRALTQDALLEPGDSFSFESPTSMRPTRITAFAAQAPDAKKSDYLPFKIELPAVEKTQVAPKDLPHNNTAPAEASDEEKRAKIVENLRMLSAAGEQCLLRHGIQSADISTISRDFPDEMKKILIPLDGEDYSGLVYTYDATLSVKTRTLGIIQYPETKK